MNTALLILDVQQSLVEEGIWDYERVITRLNRLIAMARNVSIPILLLRDTRVEPDRSFHHSLNVAETAEVLFK